MTSLSLKRDIHDFRVKHTWLGCDHLIRPWVEPPEVFNRYSIFSNVNNIVTFIICLCYKHVYMVNIDYLVLV